jgi:hypothetical protein
MNTLVNCPGCGFRGRLPDALVGLKTLVCPQCKTAVQVDQLRRHATPATDETYPIWVDGNPPPRRVASEPRVLPEPPAEEGTYLGEYMKDEATRFAQYVAARLAEIHKRRLELTEAENRFESMTMERKQEIHHSRGAVNAESERLKGLEVAFQAKETGLVARVAELAAREAEIVTRESRVARAESRAADTDRRTAELRAAIDQLEARRAAVAEERERLNQRAEELDRAELAMHRRSAELDELDERLRLEQEEFEQGREQTQTRTA